MELDSEEYRIYWAVSDAITIERKGGVPAPIDLASRYTEFKEKYFKDSVPDLSDEFVCVFQKLPFDAAGITYLDKDATRLGVKKGIRINEKLKEFPNEVQVALIHEMIHATGLRKHEADFRTALIELWNKGAYLDPLIV